MKRELQKLNKVYLESAGCVITVCEKTTLKSFFIENDYIITETYENADIIVFNP